MYFKNQYRDHTSYRFRFPALKSVSFLAAKPKIDPQVQTDEISIL
jgi:hypothetical protein